MVHKITLLRHGLSVGNQEGIIQGQMDYPLAKEGIEQSQLLLQMWLDQKIHFDTIISSPLLRAKQTAEIIGAGLEMSLELDRTWCERHQGKAEGQKYVDVKLSHANDLANSPFDPFFETGESRWDLFIRAAAAMQALLRRPPGAYLIVSHGGILNAALQTVLGVPPSPGPNSPVHIRFENTGYADMEYHSDDSRWRVHNLNVTCHLR